MLLKVSSVLPKSEKQSKAGASRKGGDTTEKALFLTLEGEEAELSTQ